MLLECRELTKEYKRGVKALNAFSACFTGGVYGILGPNGAGKSTLINILAKLILPTGGHVTWDGMDIWSMKGEYRKLIGYVPQDNPVYRWMTGREYLRYIYDLKELPLQEREQEIEEKLKQVELSARMDDKIAGYSGGMCQRLGIVQGLLGRPSILLLDEPTAGLDPRQRAIVKNMLRSYARHTVVILCTHIVSDLADIANEILMMRDGRLIGMKTPEEWLAQMEGRVWWIPESDLALKIYPTAMRHLQGGREGLRIITEKEPQDGKPLAPTLEDIYLQCYSESETHE